MCPYIIGTPFTVAGDNINHGSHLGSLGADTNYHLAVTSLVRMTISTCAAGTDFATNLELYTNCEPLGGVQLMSGYDVAHETHGDCTEIVYDFHETGTYWLVVEGRGADDEGHFTLEIDCTDVPTPMPTPAPTGVPTPVPTPVRVVGAGAGAAAAAAAAIATPATPLR